METKSTTRRDIYEYEVQSSGATRSNRIEVDGKSIVQKWLKSSQQFCREALFTIAIILIANKPRSLRLYSDEEIVVMTAQILVIVILEKEFLKSQGDDSNG